MNNATQLNERVLWYDGDSSYHPDTLCDYILSGKPLDEHIFVTELSKDIRQFNDINPNQELVKKSSLRSIANDWNIPESYKSMNIRKYILSRLLEELDRQPDLTQSDIEDRMERVEEELNLYNTNNMESILRTAIYIVDEFKSHNIVWGTGRGSSCCSYCLYLINLHDVDSVKYELDLTEFFRV